MFPTSLYIIDDSLHFSNLLAAVATAQYRAGASCLPGL
jgi:hypothetical protein